MFVSTICLYPQSGYDQKDHHYVQALIRRPMSLSISDQTCKHVTIIIIDNDRVVPPVDHST